MSRDAADVHKFDRESGLTVREVAELQFKEPLIPLLEGLRDQLEVADFVEAVKAALATHWAQQGQALAESIPNNNIAGWAGADDDPSAPIHERVTYEVIEKTDNVYEIKVTECLMAEVFREADAADIGYAVICSGDEATCQGFNPKIKLTRTKTLMQGDECCNHRWVLEG